MQTYETLFVTAPTLTEDEEQSTVDGLSRIVTDAGGSMVANERMGRRRLAYPLAKHTDGVYTRFLYDSEPAVPRELERRMGLSDRVLRVLTVRLDGNWAKAAKVQAVRDAEARAEAAERLAREEVERARLEAEGGAKDDTETEAVAAAEASPPGSDEPGADPTPAGAEGDAEEKED